MALPELNRRKPGEWCQQCTTPTETKSHREPDGTIILRREPCSSALDRLRQTGRGTGWESGEPICLASLQAAADRRAEIRKTAA